MGKAFAALGIVFGIAFAGWCTLVLGRTPDGDPYADVVPFVRDACFWVGVGSFAAVGILALVAIIRGLVNRVRKSWDTAVDAAASKKLRQREDPEVTAARGRKHVARVLADAGAHVVVSNGSGRPVVRDARRVQIDQNFGRCTVRTDGDNILVIDNADRRVVARLVEKDGGFTVMTANGTAGPFKDIAAAVHFVSNKFL